jgi:formate-dependent nitrite reductase membrane component NrfD
MKIDWKRKLTSRKFIVAVVGFITPLLIAFGLSESEVTQIVAIIVAGFNLIAYIIGEGIVDAANTDVVVLGDDNGDV